MALATAPASELHQPVSEQVSRWYALWHVMKRKPLGIASAGLMPSFLSASWAKSICMMAFFFTMPTSITRPTKA